MPHPVLFIASALAAILSRCSSAAVPSLSSRFVNVYQRGLAKETTQRINRDLSNEILSFSLKSKKNFNLGFQDDLSPGFAGQDYGNGIGSGLTHRGESNFVNEFPFSCNEGEVLNVDGKCSLPLVSKNVFVYDAPAIQPVVSPPPQVPRPKLDYNIVFVRTPRRPKNLEPIVVPPPQKKTLVYVLSENPLLEQDVIEVPPGPPQTPEVFYVNYNDGDNRDLPGGVSLQDVLSSLKQQEAKAIGGSYSPLFDGRNGGSFSPLFDGRKPRFGLANSLGSKFIAQDAGPGIYSAPSQIPLLPSPSSY